MAKKANRYFLNAQLRGSDFKEDQREFPFIITSDKEDTYRTVFSHDGWDFTRYKENPVVFYQHRSYGDNPDNLIGITVKGPDAETLEDGTKVHVATVRFEPKEVNEKAEKIRKKIIAGTLRMASIGADIHEYHWGDKDKGEDEEVVYFTRQELFEWSIVNIGSNSTAHVRNKKFMTALRSERGKGQEKPGFKITAGKKIKRKKKMDSKKKKRSKKDRKKSIKTGLNRQADLIEIAKLKSK